MADLLTTRGQLVQRGADTDSRVERAQEKGSARRNNKAKKVPTGAAVKAARASETVGSSGERAFGTPITQRDNSVAKLHEQQHTDTQNSSN